MKIFRFALCLAVLVFGVLVAQESAKVAGTWKLSLETPHGQMPGALQLKQDGVKLTGSLDVEHMGSMPLVGQVEQQAFLYDRDPGQPENQFHRDGRR
jgi:hypothetical protein